MRARGPADTAAGSERHNRHQQKEDCLCHLNTMKITEETFEWLRPSYMSDISVSLFCVANTPSLHLLLHVRVLTGSQYHSKSCDVLFLIFSLDIHPAPWSPFTRRLGLALNVTNWLRLLAPLFKPLLPESHFQPTQHHSLFRYTEHPLPCPPFNWF